MRKPLTLLAILAMILLAGACGSSDDESSSEKVAPEKVAPEKVERPTAVEMVQVAYRETAAEQTAKTSFEVTTGPTAGPENNRQAEPMTFTMRGQGVMDFSGAASSMKAGMFGMGNFEMRQVENTVYMKLPEDFMVQMLGAKPWLEIDLDATHGQQSGPNLGQMQAGIAQDPARQLEYLRDVSESVEKVAVESVRGTQTTRYKAVLDLKKAAAEEGSGAQEAQDGMTGQLGKSKLPVEV